MINIPAPGSTDESDAIIREFNYNPAKYEHDFGRCQREFRKMIRVKYAAEQAGVDLKEGSADMARAIELHYQEALAKNPQHNWMDSIREVRAESLRYRTQQAQQRYQDEQERQAAAPGILNPYLCSNEEAADIREYWKVNRNSLKNYAEAQTRYRAENPGKYGETARYRAPGTAVMGAVMKYRISPPIVKQPNGMYTLKRIPIFEKHQREDIDCDDRWMYACVADQKALKSKGYLPRLIVGHTSDGPNAREVPAAASLDNYEYDAGDGRLYADYVDVPSELLAEIKLGKWPGRSAEASRRQPRIEAVALLGGTPPYFKLPDLKYTRADIFSVYSECRYGDAGDPSSMSIQPGTPEEYACFARWWAQREFQPPEADVALDAFRKSFS